MTLKMGISEFVWPLIHGRGFLGRHMAMSRFTITDFCSHAEIPVSLDKRFIIPAGENGAGKTNLSEAISMLAPMRV